VSHDLASVAALTLHELHQVFEPSLLQGGLHDPEALLHQNVARLRCFHAGSGTFVLFATRLLQIVLKVEAEGVSTKKMWCTLSQSPAESNCSASGKK
jgi:hypothetical protein